MSLQPQDIKNSFNKAAATYEQAARLQHEIGENLLQRLTWIPCEVRRVLDVGCGSGRLTQALAAQYPQAEVLGLDLAENMLRQFPEGRAARLCGDAARLPLAARSVDIVVSNLMLQWSTDIPAMFAEFARVLRPDGILLFSTFGPDTLRELRASWAAADSHIHVNAFADMHNLGDALLGNGLVNPVMDADRLVRYYPDAPALMRELKALGAHNINTERARGLTGKGRLRRMLAAYEALRCEHGLPAGYEVLYGFARAGRYNADGGFCVPLASIGRSPVTGL